MRRWCQRSLRHGSAWQGRPSRISPYRSSSPDCQTRGAKGHGFASAARRGTEGPLPCPLAARQRCVRAQRISFFCLLRALRACVCSALHMTTARAGTKGVLIARLKGEAPPPPTKKKTGAPKPALFDSDPSDTDDDGSVDLAGSPPPRRRPKAPATYEDGGSSESSSSGRSGEECAIA